MAKRRKRDKSGKRAPTPTVSYTDAEGNELRLRESLSPATIEKIREVAPAGAGSIDDAWGRRGELIFERLAVSWEIAGLPITDQKMLLGRLRMADSETLSWVRRTLVLHVERHIPELESPL